MLIFAFAGLPVAAIVGIAIGTIALFAVALLFGYCQINRKKGLVFKQIN